MITSAWCRVKLADLEHRPVTWKWGPSVQATADVARKKAAFIRAALRSRSFDWACGAVGWRPNTARDHGFYDQEFSAVYELALAGKTNHPRVTQYLAELEQTAVRIEQMITDAPRRRAEWEAEQVRKREEKAALRAAAEPEAPRTAPPTGATSGEDAPQRPTATQATSVRPTQVERWVAARDLYPGAILSEIALAEGVTRSAVSSWRKAAVAAGIETAESDLRSKALRIRGERRRAESAQDAAADLNQALVPAQALVGQSAAPEPALILACGCSADHHCEIGAALETRARRLTAREIANGRYIRGFDPELHDAGRAVRIAYLWHRRELEHPAILAAAMTGDWCTAPATDGSTGRDQAVRTSVDRSEILEAA